jgi:uncharacterized membrane protein YdjX (TVP38/TMEM64 family)
VAPFSVINVIAGVSDIRFRDFAIGSLIGLLPGVIAIGLLADRMVASLREPTLTQIIILIAVAAVVLSGLYRCVSGCAASVHGKTSKPHAPSNRHLQYPPCRRS